MVGGQLKNLSLVELYNCGSVKNLSQFAEAAKELDISDLARKYKELMGFAPRRHERGKQYFVGHDIFLGGSSNSNRKEEHLAGALFNECRKGETFLLPGNHELKIIDYQFPLKAGQDDKGVGKIDLFGVIDDGTPCVIELKVDQDSGNMPDTPLRALLEGLAYCALVEANQNNIWEEAKKKFDIEFKGVRPHLMILAPAGYWSYFFKATSAGDWFAPFLQLIEEMKGYQLPVTSLISLKKSNFSYATGDSPACLTQTPTFLQVSQEA